MRLSCRSMRRPRRRPCSPATRRCICRCAAPTPCAKSRGALRSLVMILRGLATRHHFELFIPEGAEREFLAPEAAVAAVHVFPGAPAPPAGPGLLAATQKLLAYGRRRRRLEATYREVA